MPKDWFSFRRLFDFKGRASRREYFLFLLIGFAIYFVPMLAIASFDYRGTAGPPEQPNIPGLILLGLWSIVNLMVLVGWVAVAFRRVHDSDKSAWYLLLGAIPLIGWIFWLIWVFSPGDDFENSYGPDPRQPAEASYAGVFD